MNTSFCFLLNIYGNAWPPDGVLCPSPALGKA